MRDQELERGAHSTGTKGLRGILAQTPLPVYIQIKKQVLSLTILISKIHTVGLDIARDYPYFQPFPLLMESPHLRYVSFCLQIIYLDTQKWHHRSSVQNSTFKKKPESLHLAPSVGTSHRTETHNSNRLTVTCRSTVLICWMGKVCLCYRLSTAHSSSRKSTRTSRKIRRI